MGFSTQIITWACLLSTSSFGIESSMFFVAIKIVESSSLITFSSPSKCYLVDCCHLKFVDP
jgi:hypothetical protein